MTTNQFDTDQVGSYIDGIEEQLAHIASRRGEFMNYARQCRQEIKAIKKDAKENGIPTEILENLLADREAEAKKAKRHAAMTEDYRAPYIDLAAVLAQAKANPPVQTEMELQSAGGGAEEEEAGAFDDDEQAEGEEALAGG